MSENEISLALELRELGKYQDAQKLLHRILITDSNNPEALSLLSHIYLLDKKFTEADEILFKAKKLNPDLPSIQRNEIRLLLYQSKFSKALESAQLLYTQSAHDPENILILSSCLVASQKDNEALVYVEKALSISPNYCEAFATRALIRFRSNDIKGAIKDSRMAVFLKPHLTQFWVLLGDFYYKDKNLKDAICVTKEAYKLDPTNAIFLIKLSSFLSEDGEILEAITVLEKATSLEPENYKIWSDLGLLFQKDKQFNKAIIAYEASLAINPDAYDVIHNIGIINFKSNKFLSSKQCFERALKIKPDFFESCLYLSITLQSMGKFKDSVSVCRQAIKLNPDSPQPYNHLGISFSALDRLEEAEINFKKAITLDPNYFDAYINLGFSLQAMNKLKDAEECYNKALILNPESVPALISRWKLFFEKGEYEAALRDSDFCITISSDQKKIDPLNPHQKSLEALYALGRIEEIYERIEILFKSNPDNLEIAAFASFLAKTEKRNTVNNFCNNPMDFIYFNNISSHVEDSGAFVTEVIKELYEVETTWEPNKKATRKGFQTAHNVNLFANESEKITELKSIIISEINLYYEKFKNETCSYIKKWPLKGSLFGWHVILKQQGYQNAHIHPVGWLSGVIYLKVVPSLEKDEGAIQFNLNGEYYSNINSPKITYQPKEGDIVFFPSSLHHRTIPFTTDTDRIIISFDVQPQGLI